jgi:hypothetical protein
MITRLLIGVDHLGQPEPGYRIPSLLGASSSREDLMKLFVCNFSVDDHTHFVLLLTFYRQCERRALSSSPFATS